jgi:hypothetical protein
MMRYLNKEMTGSGDVSNTAIRLACDKNRCLGPD